MPDQDKTEQNDPVGEEELDEVDPLDTLGVLVDEINEPKQGHRARVRRLAASTGAAVRAALKSANEAPADERDKLLLAALTEIGEAAIIALEEQAETTMVLLGDLSENIVDAIGDLQEDAEISAGAPEGASYQIGIFAADSLEIRTLLQEYALILRSLGENDPQRVPMCNEKIARITRITERVMEMELPPDVTEYEDGGGEQT